MDQGNNSHAGQGDARAQFEAWAHAQSYRGGNIITNRHAEHPDVYACPNAQLTWQCWKAALAARQPVGQEPVPFAVESMAFEAHAASRKLDLSQHPLHYLFLDRVTDEARQAWKAALSFAPPAQAVDLEQQQDAARWRAIAPHLQVEWDEDEFLRRWTWIDFKRDTLSVPTRSRESYASLNEAMDAVIDSQAVGNG